MGSIRLEPDDLIDQSGNIKKED